MTSFRTLPLGLDREITEPVAQDRATPAALGAHLQAELAKWKPVIQAAGIYAD